MKTIKKKIVYGCYLPPVTSTALYMIKLDNNKTKIKKLIKDYLLFVSRFYELWSSSTVFNIEFFLNIDILSEPKSEWFYCCCPLWFSNIFVNFAISFLYTQNIRQATMKKYPQSKSKNELSSYLIFIQSPKVSFWPYINI